MGDGNFTKKDRNCIFAFKPVKNRLRAKRNGFEIGSGMQLACYEYDVYEDFLVDTFGEIGELTTVELGKDRANPSLTITTPARYSKSEKYDEKTLLFLNKEGKETVLSKYVK